VDPEPLDLDSMLADAGWLLPLARALAPDAHAAEDLVQETWLAAAREPPRIAGAERGWLSRVLRHRASRERRDSARRARRELGAARPEATPSEERLVERLELQQRVAIAVLALPAPYRETVLLRYYAELPPAEIAARQEVSVHTVNTRLRRAIERLRSELERTGFDPRLWGAALVPALAAGRSQEAGAAGATAGLGLAGGIAMSLKHVAVVATVIAAVAGIAIWRSTPREPTHEEIAAISPPEPDAPAAVVPLASGGTEGLAVAGAPAAPAASVDETAGPFLEGNVITGADGAPVPGARVILSPPRRTTARELLAERAGLVRQGNGGRIRSGSWLAVQESPDGEAPEGDGAIEVYDSSAPPAAGSPETASAEDGTFRIAAPVSGGVLHVEHSGHAPSVLIVRSLEEPVAVELWPFAPLTGYLIDVEGNRLEEPLELLFSGHGIAPVNVTATSDGSFAVDLPAGTVRAECVTPGWSLTSTGIHPERRQQWHFVSSFTPGSPDPAILVACRNSAPELVVKDEEGAAIEEFWVCIQGMNGVTRWSGRFFSPGGRMPIDTERLSRSMGVNPGPVPASLVITSPGFAPHRSELAQFPWAGEHEVVLERGEIPAVTGFVRDEHGPVVGGRVSLSVRGAFWSEREDTIVAETATAPDGTFELFAPEGEYVLAAWRGEDTIFRLARSPSEGDLRIDFASRSAIVATVRDSNGAPRVDHPVGVNSGDGMSAQRTTDSQGVARFDRFPPGAYRVFSPFTLPKDRFSFSGDVVEDVVLDERGEAAVELVIPAHGEPILPTVILEGVEDFSAWRARISAWPGDWHPVGRDGTIPIEVQLGVRTLEVEAPDRRRWDVPIPDPVPRPFEIRLSDAGRRLRCVLVEFERPRSGIRVITSPLGDDEVHTVSSVVTDARGGFEIIVPDGVPLRLKFNPDGAAFTWNSYSTPLGRIAYELRGAPDEGGPPIEIDLGPALTPLRTIRLSGDILGPGGERVPWGRLSVSALVPDRAGTLVAREWAVANADGHYELSIIDAPSYRASVSHPQSTGESHREEWTSRGLPEERRDFRLPAE